MSDNGHPMDVRSPHGAHGVGAVAGEMLAHDFLCGAQGLKGRAVVEHAGHFEESVGKSSRDDGPQEPPLARPDVAEAMGDVPRRHDHRARRHHHTSR